jgi:hypothetical protein
MSDQAHPREERLRASDAERDQTVELLAVRKLNSWGR